MNEMYLSSGVNDFGSIFLIFVLYDFAECILDCRIVTLDEVAIDVLNGEGRFSYRDGISIERYLTEMFEEQ